MPNQLTNANLTSIASKRIAGKAMTSGRRDIGQEPIGSFMQLTNATVFADAFPQEPLSGSDHLYLIQSASDGAAGSVMWVEFDLEVLPNTAYSNDAVADASTAYAAQVVFDNDLGDQTSFGDTDTFHGYALKLPSGFVTSVNNVQTFADHASTNKVLGTDAPLLNSFNATGSSQFQVVPEYVTTVTTNNPYIPYIIDKTGTTLATDDGIDYYLDTAAGILFVQDPRNDYNATAAQVPDKLVAFLYVGRYQNEITFTGFTLSGSNAVTEINNDENVKFQSGSAGITVELSSNTITIGQSTDNVTFTNITASVINADRIEATEYIVSSSVTYMTQSFSSGSTIFGDTDDDTHQFTGSIQILHTGSGYGFQMSGSNFSIDWGDSGSVTLGEYNVGNELGNVLPITGSGLIISQSFTNEQTHHNMVKIGETELVDISGSAASDSFLINVREKALIISSSALNIPLAKIAPGDTIFYAQTTNQAAIKIAGDSLTLGSTTNNDDTTIYGDDINILATTALNIGVNVEDDYTYNANKSLLIGQTTDINGAIGSQVKAAFLDNIYPLFKGAVTASAVSSSGLLYASSSDAGAGGSIYQVALLDTASGLFYTTASSAIQGDTTDIEADITELQASASAGIQFRTGSHTVGTSIALMGTASFIASGDGLSVDEDSGTITYTIGGGILSSSYQIEADISGAIDAATGSLSASILGTANEVEVTSTGPGNITIGLPDDVIIAGNLTVQGTTTTIDTDNLLVEDSFIQLASGSGTSGNGGIIVERATDNTGTALFWDEANDVWAVDLAGASAPNNTATTDASVVFVSHSSANPSGTPLMGAGDWQLGQMYIATTDNDNDGNNIWIYA